MLLLLLLLLAPRARMDVRDSESRAFELVSGETAPLGAHVPVPRRIGRSDSDAPGQRLPRNRNRLRPPVPLEARAAVGGRLCDQALPVAMLVLASSPGRIMISSRVHSRLTRAPAGPPGRRRRQPATASGRKNLIERKHLGFKSRLLVGQYHPSTSLRRPGS